MNLNWKGILLWSNQFYGFCAVLLCIESSMILLHTYPNPFLLLLIYLGTIVYYTHAYLQEAKLNAKNERVIWYQKHKSYLYIRQVLFTIVCLFIALVKLDLLNIILDANVFIKCMILFAGVLSVAYYLPNTNSIPFRSYRTKGIFKSIAIAWVWAFTCCFIPIWLGAGSTLELLHPPFILYFIGSFLYVLVLAILFDIKDIQKDEKDKVNTIALRLGADTTIRKIIAPLLVLYYIIIIYWVYMMGISPLYLMFQGLLTALTYFIAHKVLIQKPIYLHILYIDGLLLLKAMLSIIFLYLKQLI